MSRHLIIAGMQRSGTTWLYHLLGQHPQVEMAWPANPEPKFFLKAESIDGGYAAYRKLFSRAEPQFTGWFADKSTSYSEFSDLPQVISIVLEEADDIRILFMIRHPIKRAISNVRFSQNNGLETRSVSKALEENLAGPTRQLGLAGASTSVDPNAYLERGLYWRQIEPYLQVFGTARINVLVSEEVFGNAAAVKGIIGWLGLKQVGLPRTFGSPINQSTIHWQQDDRVPDHLYRELQEYYRQPNLELAAGTQLDLSVWSRLDDACRSAT